MACPSQHRTSEYAEEHLRALAGLEPIRRNPGMFAGSDDARGLFYILFSLVTNAFAEVVAGYGRSVRVTLHADGSAEVADDGRLLPDDVAVELAFATFGTGYRGYCPYSSGREYFEYLIANALSEHLTVFARDDGRVHQHTFRRGLTHVALQSDEPAGDHGLTVAFRPDPLIFGDARFDSVAIRDRLRQLAFLHSGVRVTFTDEPAGTRDEFEYADGISEYVGLLNAARRPLHPDVIVFRDEEQGVRYEVGLQWCEDIDVIRMSFANHYHTAQGGTHDYGLRSGAAQGLRDFVQTAVPESGKLNRDDLCSGLTAIVSVWLADPRFESATRSRLGNPEVEAIVAGVVRRGVRDYLAAHPDIAADVVREVVVARDARLAAATVRRQQRRLRNGE